MNTTYALGPLLISRCCSPPDHEDAVVGVDLRLALGGLVEDDEDAVDPDQALDDAADEAALLGERLERVELLLLVEVPLDDVGLAEAAAALLLALLRLALLARAEVRTMLRSTFLYFSSEHDDTRCAPSGAGAAPPAACAAACAAAAAASAASSAWRAISSSRSSSSRMSTGTASCSTFAIDAFSSRFRTWRVGCGASLGGGARRWTIRDRDVGRCLDVARQDHRRRKRARARACSRAG